MEIVPSELLHLALPPTNEPLICVGFVPSRVLSGYSVFSLHALESCLILTYLRCPPLLSHPRKFVVCTYNTVKRYSFALGCSESA